MHTLENSHLRFSIDQHGRLCHLINVATGRDYAGNGPLWRIIYQHGSVWEEEITADNTEVNIQPVDGKQLQLDYSHLYSAAGPVAFKVVITVTLIEDELHFSAAIANHETAADIIWREFHFPIIQNIQLLPETGLLWSENGGTRYPRLIAKFDSLPAVYMAQDNKALEFSSLYPGSSSVNCFFLEDQKQIFYMASYDLTFQNTLHLMRKRGAERDVAMVKYPFLKPGENMTIDNYILALLPGSWHQGANRYRCWCDTWMKVPEKPASICNSNGWHRLIFRHQYGKTLFHYRDMPRILASGLAAGIDTLFMFGWTNAGHDAEYPEYICDMAQGGKDALKHQIAEFQSHGGKVILYFNGQLIDTNTKFYQQVGHKIAVKLPSGREHTECYPFGGDGTALRLFGNKVFVVACTYCQEWHEHLKTLIDLAIELGCGGVFFDQIGHPSRSCFDPNHGHRVPFMNFYIAKSELLAELREYLKRQRPEMSFGIEWDNDITSQHVDFIHNVSGTTDVNNCDWMDKTEMPQCDSYQELVRYLFPEQILTDRDIRDDQDIERRVNHAVRLGLHSDVEIYRCREIIDVAPHYKEYLTLANAFRCRNRSLIMHGRFRDIQGATCDNPQISYSVFENDKEIGVLLTQSHLDFTKTILSVPQGSWTGFDTVDTGYAEAISDNAVAVNLPRHALVLVKFIHNLSQRTHTAEITNI